MGPETIFLFWCENRKGSEKNKNVTRICQGGAGMHSCFLPAYPFPFLLPEVLRAIFFVRRKEGCFSAPASCNQSAGRAFSDGIHNGRSICPLSARCRRALRRRHSLCHAGFGRHGPARLHRVRKSGHRARPARPCACGYLHRAPGARCGWLHLFPQRPRRCEGPHCGAGRRRHRCRLSRRTGGMAAQYFRQAPCRDARRPCGPARVPACAPPRT